MFNKTRYRLVFNRRHQLNRDGRGLVQTECLLNGRRVYFSTNVYLYPDQWDGCWVTNHPLSADLNKYLFEEIINLQRIEFSFIQRGRQPTLAMMKNAVRNDITVTALFSQFVKSVTQHSASRGKHTKDSYLTLIKIVDTFRKGTTLADIDIDWLNRFVDWQQNQGLPYAAPYLLHPTHSKRSADNDRIKIGWPYQDRADAKVCTYCQNYDCE